jgi:hypothetical protein
MRTGELKTRGLLRLDAVRGMQVDDEGVLVRPASAGRAAVGGPPGTPSSRRRAAIRCGRRWDSYYGFAGASPSTVPLHGTSGCTRPGRKGLSVRRRQVQRPGDRLRDGRIGGRVRKLRQPGLPGQRESRSRIPNCLSELIAALSVWQDRLFVVDVLNRRIVKCRIFLQSVLSRMWLDAGDAATLVIEQERVVEWKDRSPTGIERFSQTLDVGRGASTTRSMAGRRSGSAVGSS